jgi:hypothetical protein
MSAPVMDFIDDDENVKAMRETARTIGLTDLLLRANNSTEGSEVNEFVRQALRLLGVSAEELAKR